MKKLIIIPLLLIVFSCNSQGNDRLNNNLQEDTIKPIQLEIPLNPKTMETFTTEEFTKEDIEIYIKNKGAGNSNYQYTREDGAVVLESDDDMILFARFVTPRNSLFTIFKEYHPNRRLWMKYERYKGGGFTKGIFYTYSEDGKLIKAQDWDKPFKFTWEQVKKYCEEELKLDLIKDKVGIGNHLEYSGYNFPTWSIEFEGAYKEHNGKYKILLNGLTGEILLVKRFIGAGVASPDGTGKSLIYETIQDTKAENKKKEEEDNAYYKTYKGKDYTKKEWEAFEEEWYEDYKKNKNKGFWDDIFKRP